MICIMEQSFKIRLRGLLVVLLSLQTHYAYSQDFDCHECFEDFDFNALDANPDCEIILHTINCYYNNIDRCFEQSFQLVSFYYDAVELSDRYGCENLTTTPDSNSITLPPSSPPHPVNCPSILTTWVDGSSETINMQDFVSADVLPSVEPKGCTMYSPNDLQHCSMFAFSHLRAFGGYRRGLETCSIPGAWDLFRHSAFSVQVNGEMEDVNSSHTKLTQINVTFYQTDCLEETKSYVVDHRFPLPHSFTDDTNPDPQNSSLLLNTDDNGTVATILAIWINTTIVIRRHAGLLSITLQVPGMVSFQSEGLCTGCPPHAYVNITQFQLSIQEDCAEQTSSVNVNCFLRAGVANEVAFDGIGNNTYLESCVYSLFKGGSVGVLEMFNRVARDAKLLPSNGNVPARPTPPNTPVVMETEPSPPITVYLDTNTTTCPPSTMPPEKTRDTSDVTDAFSSARPQTFLTLHSNLATAILIVCISVLFLTR